MSLLTNSKEKYDTHISYLGEVNLKNKRNAHFPLLRNLYNKIYPSKTSTQISCDDDSFINSILKINPTETLQQADKDVYRTTYQYKY